MSLLRTAPSQRRLLYVLDAGTYATLGGRELAELERGHNLQVVNLMALQATQHDELAARLVDNPATVPGAVLVQDPFRRDTYFDAAVAERSIALEKAQILSRLSQSLGARSLHFEEMDTDRDHQMSSGGIDASHKGVQGDLGVTHDVETIRNDLIQVTDKFTGAEPDTAAARQLLADHHLLDESELVSLVASMEQSNNPLTERSVTMSVNREVLGSLEVVADLGVKLVGKVSAKYSKASTSRREIRATYKICF